MAKLYITEFSDTMRFPNGGVVQISLGAPVTDQVVSYSTTTQSAAFNADTRLIRVHTDSICSILIGSNPTATTSTGRMAADQTEYFGVQPGQKIAAVTNT